MNLMLLNGWNPPGGRLKIHEALWCGESLDNFKPVTPIIRGAISRDGKRIHYRVHQDFLGDPFANEAKKLRVRYSLGRVKNREIIVRSGDYLTIPEPE